MNDFEKIIMEEISSLDEMRLIDVIGFIRYLKAEKPVRQEWITSWYESALESIHDREEELNITPTDIDKQRKKQHGQ
ncbi:MAG: hypothetical protein J0M11_08125 [Anaerolineae bacterium]|nr:hypothetical protein [Anaerolineae bacterium]